jgi:predicted secreted protein
LTFSAGKFKKGGKMSNAVSGMGTIFRRWSGAAWANIAEITSITGPGMSRTTIDVTSLSSTGGYGEFIAGMRKAGTVTLKMNFTRATYDLMKDDFEDDALQNYEIVLPDLEHTTLEFEGLVTELPLTITTDAQITADVTIQVSGQVVVNSGTSTGLT